MTDARTCTAGATSANPVLGAVDMQGGETLTDAFGTMRKENVSNRIYSPFVVSP